MPGGLQIPDKDIFFKNLYALDDSDSEPDRGLQRSIRALQQGHLPEAAPPQDGLSGTVRKLHRNAPLTNAELVFGLDGTADAPPVPFQTRRGSALVAKLKSSATTTGPETATGTLYQSNDTIPRPSGEMAARQSNGPDARISEKQSTFKDPRRLFAGLHFYFFPNNDIHPGRRLRIKKACDFGAVWERQWSGKVSHIVADRTMTYRQLLAYIDVQTIPPGVVVVNEDYPARCLDHRLIISPNVRQFRVDGAPEQSVAAELPTVSSSVSAISDSSLKLKPTTPAVTAREADTLSQTSQQPLQRIGFHGGGNSPAPPPLGIANHGDALDEMIKEAIRYQHMVIKI